MEMSNSVFGRGGYKEKHNRHPIFDAPPHYHQLDLVVSRLAFTSRRYHRPCVATTVLNVARNLLPEVVVGATFTTIGSQFTALVNTTNSDVQWDGHYQNDNEDGTTANAAFAGSATTATTTGARRFRSQGYGESARRLLDDREGVVAITTRELDDNVSCLGSAHPT